ncbi:MAG: ribosomal-protein-alanine N-acetyltransferase [Chloroflexi bacterium]|nr:MAG: ribosomal-protein-alanine N-acetyltransferase [Chloroflexota bacterium]
MLHLPHPFALRAMRLSDIDAVLAVDRLSFPTPARPSLFEHELTDNPIASYQVLTLAGDEGEQVIGFAGFWLIADEVHVSTIAVHPDWRGYGLGEALLLNLLLLAYAREEAALATLEVRRSNLSAQALYRKYRFEVVGERRRYYRDTGEDALIMTVASLDEAYWEFLQVQVPVVVARLSRFVANSFPKSQE